MELGRAHGLAVKLPDELQPRCARIAIAGGIVRLKPQVHDIDIVAIPKMAPGQMQISLFPDEPAPMVSDLENVDWAQIGRVLMSGERLKKIELDLAGGETLNLEVNIVLPPAQWGVKKVLCTGPAEFNHWLVTPKRYGGAMPSHLKQTGGSLWAGTTQILTPEEEDYFQALGLAYKAPTERRAPQGFGERMKVKGGGASMKWR